MVVERKEDKSAAILAGPGLIRQPRAVADALDERIKEAIASLEELAGCPSPDAFDLPQGLGAAGRMFRFCEALDAIGKPLLDGLAECYSKAVKGQRFHEAEHLNLFKQRAYALLDYFIELARVHGVAFAEEEGPPPADAVEQALARLHKSLDMKIQTAIDRMASS